jgi:predicted DNA-binding protein with PD1-like motif
MRRVLWLAAVWLTMTMVSAQSGGTGTPAPAVHTTSSQIERVVIVRLKNGTDLLSGLADAVAREKIVNGVILSGFGSVTSYHVHVVDNTTFPPRDVFTKGEGPYDLLNVSGLVMNGRVHPHITIGNPKQVVGGHLEPGTSVFTFANISIAVLNGSVDLSRNDDWKW